MFFMELKLYVAQILACVEELSAKGQEILASVEEFGAK